VNGLNSEDTMKLLDLFKEGRRLYTLRKFAEAREAFRRACEIDREDGPSRIYHTRCTELIEGRQKLGEDGVFVMKEK
jgi:hypothetical protein